MDFTDVPCRQIYLALEVTVRHHEEILVMPNGDPGGLSIRSSHSEKRIYYYVSFLFTVLNFKCLNAYFYRLRFFFNQILKG